MINDVESILFDEHKIAVRVAELGALITQNYNGKNLLCIGILNGSAVFLSDLIRKIDLPIRIEFMAASSYGSGATSSGNVKITRDLNFDISGYDVLIIEDIMDTGFTLFQLKKILAERGPKSVKLCTLLDKPSRRCAEISPDYTGFTVPDEFIVGYGLDYNNRYRNLPYIGILKSAIYK